ncbi:MAG: hypothetical protein IH795_11080, partial [Bacteroidetes bacterium]|nr:hypothetical protein [Bacteroidota bacterium]
FMIGPWLGTQVLDSRGSFILWTGCFVLGAMSAVMMLILKKVTFTKNESKITS